MLRDFQDLHDDHHPVDLDFSVWVLVVEGCIQKRTSRPIHPTTRTKLPVSRNDRPDLDRLLDTPARRPVLHHTQIQAPSRTLRSFRRCEGCHRRVIFEIWLKPPRQYRPTLSMRINLLPHLNNTHGKGFGVWGLGFGVWGLGFGVWGL